MSKIISFFVEGEPLPFPKKRTSKSGMIYSYDPSGKKRGWMQNIALTAKEYMAKYNLEPFGEKDAIFLKCIFYITRPKSCKKREYPYTKPDCDNLMYSVSNALIGVCYHDDSRVICPLPVKLYANEGEVIGVQISIELFTDDILGGIYKL